MKYVALILTLLGTAALAQQEKEVESRITQVTAFLNKAQVNREIKTTLPAGKVSLVVTGLTSVLEPESIQASGKGNFIILGIAHRHNFLTERNFPKPLKAMQDSMEYYQRQLILEQSQKEILGKEEQMLLSNQRIGGN